MRRSGERGDIGLYELIVFLTVITTAIVVIFVSVDAAVSEQHEVQAALNAALKAAAQAALVKQAGGQVSLDPATAQQVFNSDFPVDLGPGLASDVQVVNVITYNTSGVTPPGMPAGDATPGPSVYAQVALTVDMPALFVGHPVGTMTLQGLQVAPGYNGAGATFAGG